MIIAYIYPDAAPHFEKSQINIVDLNYQKTTYANWKPIDSGLNNVTLTTDN